MGPGLRTLCIAIGLTSWVRHCRIIRSEFMKHREREYVQGAFALGASNFRRIFIHILPNTFHLVLVNFSLLFVGAIKSEVILSYLGLRRESWYTELGDDDFGCQARAGARSLVGLDVRDDFHVFLGSRFHTFQQRLAGCARSQTEEPLGRRNHVRIENGANS